MTTKLTTKKTTAKKVSKKLIWNEAHDSLYSMLYGKLLKKDPDADKDTYIIDNANPRKLMSFIESTKYVDSSKKNLYFMVGRYLQIRNNIHYKAYLEKGHQMKLQVEKDESQNVQTEKEKLSYRDHEYFMSIIESEKEDYTVMNYKPHINFLVLCLTVLQPPLRSDFYCSAQFITQKSEDDNENNFIFINKKTKKIYYIVNKDKVTKTKFYKMHPEHKTIEVEDPFLKELIEYSYEVYNRKYLLQASYKVDTPVAQNSYLSYLRKATLVPEITNDIMRSSYINWFHNHHKKHSDKEALSHKMRHSLITAQKNYFKDLEDEDESQANPEEVSRVKADNEVLVTKLEKCQNNKLSEAEYTKKRYNVIFNLNNGHSNTPRKSTVEKYNIQLDEETGEYY